MKKVLLVIVAAVICLSATAKIWRVNNTGLPADFTSIQAAHDAIGVNAGDTIHLESSQTSYGDLTATKYLIILGPGYYLDQNLNNQQDHRGATVGSCAFNIGSEGTVVSGLTIGEIQFYTGYISIVRNYIAPLIQILGGINNFGNISIIQNYIVGSLTSSGSGVYSNIIIANNFFQGEINLQSGFSANIINNTCTSDLNAYYSNIQNNIVQGVLTPFAGNTILNNLYGGTNLFAPNQTIINWNSLFTGIGTGDGQWQLAIGSQAIGAGNGGVDCGMYGGPNPYKLSGLPAIPSIYTLTAPASTNNNILPVIISVKSNN